MKLGSNGPRESNGKAVVAARWLKLFALSMMDAEHSTAKAGKSHLLASWYLPIPGRLWPPFPLPLRSVPPSVVPFPPPVPRVDLIALHSSNFIFFLIDRSRASFVCYARIPFVARPFLCLRHIVTPARTRLDSDSSTPRLFASTRLDVISSAVSQRSSSLARPGPHVLSKYRCTIPIRTIPQEGLRALSMSAQRR